MIQVITFILLLTTAEHATAETVYIRDIIYVPLRGGQSQEHRILHRGLRSGLKLERLETNNVTGYSKVKTETGLEGWLENQYLVTEPIAVERLDSITLELEKLETMHQKTLLELREVSGANKNLSAELAKLTESEQELAREIEEITSLAANTINIDKKNSILNNKHQELKKRVDELSMTNQTLLEKDAQKWFIGGSASVLLGLLFGLWVGRMIYQKNNRGGWV